MLCTASACLPHGHRVFPVLSPAVCGALGLFDLPAAFDSVDPTLLLETLHLLDSRTPLSLVVFPPHWLLLLCVSLAPPRLPDL